MSLIGPRLKSRAALDAVHLQDRKEDRGEHRAVAEAGSGDRSAGAMFLNHHPNRARILKQVFPRVKARGKNAVWIARSWKARAAMRRAVDWTCPRKVSTGENG